MGNLLLIFSLLYICFDLSNSSSTDSTIDDNLACKLYNKTNLDCSSRNLQRIPPLKTWTPTTLDLSLNNISYMDDTLFPESLMELKKLDIRNNRLGEINDGVFQVFESLMELQLSFNNIWNLAPQGFLGLDSLQDLSLSDNQISSLPSSIFLPAKSLLNLNLSNNNLRDLPNEAVASLQSLEMLDLRGNMFTKFELRPAFKHLFRLSKLYFGTINTHVIKKDTFQFLSGIPVSSMSIKFPNNCIIPADIFKPLSYLKNFEVSLPNTTSLSSLNSPLETLTLETQNLPNVLNSSLLSSLKMLPLKKINILDAQSTSSHLIQDIFTNFPHLEELKISGNRQDLFLTNESFKGLKTLKALDISNNMLADSQMQTLFNMLRSHKSLKFLDLRFTSIYGIFNLDSVPNGIETLDLSSNYFIALNYSAPKPCSISELRMENMMSGMFGLRVTFSQNLYNLHTLRMAQMRSAPTEAVFDYPLCLKAPYISFVNMSSVHGHWTPASALGQKCKYLEKLDISDSHVVDYYQLEVTYPKLNLLKASSNGFESLDQVLFIKAPQLQVLDLSYNEIEVITEHDIQAFANLTSLNLKYNHLTQSESLQILKHLDILKLSNNFIKMVPNYVFYPNKSSGLQLVDLSDNPFQCDCSIAPFINWILHDKYTLLIPGNGYQCDSPDLEFGTSITKLDLQCKTHLTIFTLATSVISAFLCCIVALLVFCLRKHIRRICSPLFAQRSASPYSGLIDETSDIDPPSTSENHVSVSNFHPHHEGYTYDAYIAYHANNSNWVQQLLNHTEQRHQPFRLCLPIRDLPVTTNEVDQMTIAIENSAKAIVLLSKDFVQDEWGKIEVLMAHTKSENENLKTLIFVLLEDIPADEMPRFFKKVMHGKDIFKWPGESGNLQDVFWCHLRRELCNPVKMKRGVMDWFMT